MCVLNSKNLPKLPVFSIFIGNFVVEIVDNLIICEYSVKHTVLIFLIILVEIIGFPIFLEMTWPIIDSLLFPIVVWIG